MPVATMVGPNSIRKYDQIQALLVQLAIDLNDEDLSIPDRVCQFRTQRFQKDLLAVLLPQLRAFL